MMYLKQFTLSFLALLVGTSAFVQPNARSNAIASSMPQSTVDTTTSTSSSSSTALYALEGQSPQLRKNVMAATVSVFAMPTIATFLAPIATAAATAIPAAWATQNTVQWLVNKGEESDPLLLGGIFVVHWFITNIVLQKFKDVGEE